MARPVFNKMAAAVIVLLNTMAMVAPHFNIFDSFESAISGEGVGHIKAHEHRRIPEGSFEGLTIEDMKKNYDENKIFQNEWTTKASPPLDKRYRRIYNPDEVANIEDYPFMAALLVNNELWCGAAIIGSDKILTAAHCLQLQYNNRFFREYVKMLTVRVGSSNASAGGEIMRVTDIFFHPNYKPQTLAFNFAILKLHKNVTLGKRDWPVGSIEMTKDKVIPVDNEIIFLGWGSVLSFDGAGGRVLLQKVKLPIYDTADCQEIYGKELVTRTNFCAGFITIPKNVCNHDAGGPAIMDGKLIGILSFSSKRCDQPDQPAVFSSVGAVDTWISDVGENKVPLHMFAAGEEGTTPQAW